MSVAPPCDWKRWDAQRWQRTPVLAHQSAAFVTSSAYNWRRRGRLLALTRSIQLPAWERSALPVQNRVLVCLAASRTRTGNLAAALSLGLLMAPLALHGLRRPLERALFQTWRRSIRWQCSLRVDILLRASCSINLCRVLTCSLVALYHGGQCQEAAS